MAARVDSISMRPGAGVAPEPAVFTPLTWNTIAARWRVFLRRTAARIPYKSPPFREGQGIGLLCAAVGLGIRLSLTPLIHNALPVVLFYPFVLIASVWGGTLAGFTVLILCGAAADYFWLPPDGATLTLVAFSIACLSAIAMAGLFRVLVGRHVEEEARATLLTHEMTHRANNLFGVVQAISAQTARGAASVADHQAQFGARLMALARAQQLVSDNPEAPPALAAFLGDIVAPFGAGRFVLEGPEVHVPHYHGTSIALLLHELSTNATKYGALSVPDGSVVITWKIDAKRIRLHWRELNGPRVTAPARLGFGSRLLKTAFPPKFGDAAISFDPDGVECQVSFALL